MKGSNHENKSASHLILTGLFAVLVLATSNSIVRAQECPGTSNWIGGTGGWFTGTNWSNGCVPSVTIDATINNGGHAQNLGGSVFAAAESLILGDNQGDTGSVTVDGASAVLDLGNSTCRGTIYVGNRGIGNLTIGNGGTIRSRYAYIAAVANPERPASSGNVTVASQGIQGVAWYLYDHYDPGVGCTGAGLFIGTADNSGAGGTATVDVSNGSHIEVTNRGNAPGVTVGLSGTLTGNGVVLLSQGTQLAKTVKVLGTLAPKGGALSIFGNLDLTASTANTVFNVTPQAWDNVQVSQATGGGLATLGGRVTVIMTGSGFTSGMSFSLLYADAGRNGTMFAFESITPPVGGPCFTPVIHYETNRVKLDLMSCTTAEAEP
jgi:T5SS/PEP-CTERM-associated repeat protein